ncbi:MAG: peptidoglycan bridge formation glycyltransferase FemA/FemB family protein [Oscillospiraceae bacterium]|jgi:lipid II:glycine glycyltransferase (peptidoglycan interpeptide bridge formation enzyme)|nr:peptidoglycan bridge formation glycyltransferase FemA/FemB family protein [Oscillospiraceae bacterium]
MQDLQAFIENHPKGHFMQAPFWGKLKREWQSDMLTVRSEDGEIKGCMQVLSRRVVPLLPFSMMYAPRGPVCDIHDTTTLAALTEQAKALAKKRRGYSLLLDPDVSNAEMAFLAAMEGLGYKHIVHENFEGVQASHVFRLNLAGKTEDEIRAGFHQKTRYNVGLAARKGVTVRVGTVDDLPRFYEIMCETGLRDHFVPRSLQYFQRIFATCGDCVRLFLAEYEGKTVAGTIEMRYGDKGWYLYGCSSNEARNVMPSYLLQWEMIRWAREGGCRLYDFRGVPANPSDDNPLTGLYRFKKGFGGDLVEFVGELELTFKPLTAFAVKKAMRVFMKLRTRIFLRRGK